MTVLQPIHASLDISLTSAIWIYNAFEDNFEIKHKSTNYFENMLWSGYHFPSNIFWKKQCHGNSNYQHTQDTFRLFCHKWVDRFW